MVVGGVVVVVGDDVVVVSPSGSYLAPLGLMMYGAEANASDFNVTTSSRPIVMSTSNVPLIGPEALSRKTPPIWKEYLQNIQDCKL